MAHETRIGRLKRNKPFQNLEHDPFYTSKIWRNIRAWKFKKNPICEMVGCLQPTHTIDHIKPIRQGGAKTSEDNLRSLCKTHNFSKTGRQGRGNLDLG
jgi:5-methylcytosine-specific restriction endonuclease McrA